MITDKIGPHQLEHKAILYVRCANPRPTKCCTTARAARCNTPCGIGC